MAWNEFSNANNHDIYKLLTPLITFANKNNDNNNEFMLREYSAYMIPNSKHILIRSQTSPPAVDRRHPAAVGVGSRQRPTEAGWRRLTTGND